MKAIITLLMTLTLANAAHAQSLSKEETATRARIAARAMEIIKFNYYENKDSEMKHVTFSKPTVTPSKDSDSVYEVTVSVEKTYGEQIPGYWYYTLSFFGEEVRSTEMSCLFCDN